jgi:hypothetical protein
MAALLRISYVSVYAYERVYINVGFRILVKRVGVSDPGVPGPTSKFVAACPCPDGLVRDGTQGENKSCIILHQGARSSGYKRCDRARAGERVGGRERERGSGPVRLLPSLCRASTRLPPFCSWTSPFIDIRRWPSCTMGV